MPPKFMKTACRTVRAELVEFFNLPAQVPAAGTNAARPAIMGWQELRVVRNVVFQIGVLDQNDIAGRRRQAGSDRVPLAACSGW